MKFTRNETAMRKLAAAYMAPQLLKRASLQDKLADYGIGLQKKAFVAGQVGKIPKPMPFPRETWKEGIQSQIREWADPVGWGKPMVNFLNKSRAANNQMPLPTQAERNKADEIYGNVGDMTPGGVLRQPTAFDGRWQAYMENRMARINALMAARENARKQREALPSLPYTPGTPYPRKAW